MSGLRVAVLAAVVAAMALPPQLLADRRSGGRETIENAMPATVMVIAADIVDGELVPIANGSGTVISPEGAILTNHHVISDGARGRPHDVFVIARLEAPGRPLAMTCAGVPARGMLAPNLDLAVVQCELDLDGLPVRAEQWPALSVGESKHISPGERLWVLGYPDTGGMALRDSFGQVLGWAGEAGGPGESYIKTDAVITHGNSGGAAIDQRGDLIGVPSAYRLRRDASGETTVAVGSVGLIRPIHAARPLIDEARAGWQPRAPRPFGPQPADGENEGKDEDAAGRRDDGAGASPEGAGGTENAPEASGERRGPAPQDRERRARGVRLTGRVVSAHSGAPIAGAVVAILDPGADPRSDKPLADTLAWAETDTSGVFRFDDPVSRRQAYPVVVMARGYAAAVASSELALPADAPQLYGPFDPIELRPTRLH